MKFRPRIAAVLLSLTSASIASACTRVLWNSGNGHVMVGRTQDWTERANSAFRVYPRGIQRVGAVAENPHKWTSKYGSVALSAYDMGTHEGVNEKGLSAHALYLAEENSFDPRDPALEGIGIMQWVQYYLDNYATVAEAVDASLRARDHVVAVLAEPDLVDLAVRQQHHLVGLAAALRQHVAGLELLLHEPRGQDIEHVDVLVAAVTPVLHDPRDPLAVDHPRDHRARRAVLDLVDRPPEPRTHRRCARLHRLVRAVALREQLIDRDHRPSIARITTARRGRR